MDYSSFDDPQDIALAKFESMLKSNHILFFDANEFESIIHHYLDNGKIALAKKAIKMGLLQHPDCVNLKLFKIELLIYEYKLDEAEELLDKLYDLEPHNEDIYIQKATIFSKREKHHIAIKWFNEALTYAQEKSEIYSLIGREYLFLEYYEEAKTNFMFCIELDALDYSALFNIINCYENLDQSNEAIGFLSRYLDNNPYSEVAWHQLARQYTNINEYRKALSALDFAIISDDTFVGAYIDKGRVLEKLGRYKEAIESYKITLALEDPTSYVLLNIGICFEKLGRQDKAMQYYNKSVEADPYLDKGWLALAHHNFKIKEYHKALHYINKALHIDAENVEYLLFFTRVNQRLNFLEEAESGYRKILELECFKLEIWLERADILIALGEIKEAVSNLNKALKFHPKNAEIEFRLAGLHFIMKHSQMAHIHLKKALLINEEYVFILEDLFPKIYNQLSRQKIL